jgi:hypothetical protein
VTSTNPMSTMADRPAMTSFPSLSHHKVCDHAKNRTAGLHRLGCHQLAGALLRQRRTPVELAGIASKNTPEARAQLPAGIPFLKSTDELAALKSDLVIEAAGRPKMAGRRVYHC